MITEDITNQFPPVYARLLLSCGKTYPVKSSYSKESYEVRKFAALNRESIIQLLEADVVYHTAFAGIAQDKLDNFLKNEN